MEIVVAREIGYCYGVRDAVEKAVEEARKARGRKVYTFGPIIHNRHAIDTLRERHNIHAVDSMDEIGEKGAVVVIRTHGATPGVKEGLIRADFEVRDATCPFVLKTQRLACELAGQGYHIVILGHRNHPEVIGIAGHVPGKCTIVDVKEDIEKVGTRSKIAVVFQSTVAFEDYAWALPALAARCGESKVLQTVCGVTMTRRKCAEEVARQVDLMIVVGGRHSSNTKKLAGLCEKLCRTSHIEEPEEADAIDFTGVRRVGVSTGTSTPDSLVDALVERLKARTPPR